MSTVNLRLIKHSELELVGVILFLLLSLDLNTGVLPGFFTSTLTFVAYIVPFIILLQYRTKILVALSYNLPLLGLILLVCVSYFWSASPIDTANHIRAFLRTVIFSTYFGFRFSTEDQVKIIMFTLGIAAISSLAVGIALPNIGIDSNGLWKGVFKHKNHLARAMSFTGMIYLLNLLYHPGTKIYRAILLIVVSISLLLLSQGKTALAILCLSFLLLPIMIFIKQKKMIKLYSIIFSVWAIVSLGFFSIAIIQFIVVDFLGKDLTLTGRLDIWPVILEKANERPWLGHGYGGFWNNYDIATYISQRTWLGSQFAGQSSGHSHSGYIDLYVQLGWVGISLFIASTILMIYRIILLLKRYKKPEYLWCLIFIFAKLAFNISITNSLVTLFNFFWILYISTSVSNSVDLFSRASKPIKNPYLISKKPKFKFHSQ